MMATKVVATAVVVPAAGYVVPMWGTSVSSFGLAAIGAVMSYAWDKPEADRRVLLFKTLSVTLFSVAAVVALPDLAGWELMPRTEPPLAFIIALFGRHIIPAIRQAAPAIGRAIAGMFSKRDNYSNYSNYGDHQDYGNDQPSNSDDPRRKGKRDEGEY